MNIFDITNRRLYILCFIPRSGSNHLCSLLERHGIGAPSEYYFPYDRESRYRNWNHKLKAYFNGTAADDPIEYFKRIFVFQPTIAGIKTSWDSLQTMISEVGTIITQLEPQYIYLTRSNKIMQAISWAKSASTQIWSSDDLHTPSSIPIYSKDKIDEYLGYINDYEAKFSEYLQDKPHIHITYENINDRMIVDIADFLQTPIIYGHNKILSEYKQLRDHINDEWYAAYTNQ